MAFNPAFADAIAAIESGGKYGILGPVTKSGDRAYGKYQVMGSNIPVWTKEVLGAPMSPQEFLNNPQAQDAVFQAKFGQYAEKYGPEGAAQAWFAGPGGVGKLDRKDQLGTSVGAYGQKFMAGLGSAGGPVNAPAPISGPPPQAPMPQKPAPAPVGQPYAVQGGDLMQMAPLNAPPPLQAVRQFNLAKAFQNIPLPPGFRGFSIG
jgi:hypothetical protein